MSTHTKEELQVRPIFDFELLLGLLNETRLGGSINDNWGAHASTGVPLLDGVASFYGKLLRLFLDDARDEV